MSQPVSKVRGCGMATAVTSLRIPTDLSERYNRLAKETGRSRSYYVRRVSRDGAADEEVQA